MATSTNEVKLIVEPSKDKARSNYKPTWMTILFKSKTFNDKGMEAIATLVLGQVDERIPYGLRVNGTPIDMKLRRSTYRQTHDVKISFIRREVFSTFPHVINEYTALIELTSVGNDSEIKRPILSVPAEANISQAIDFADSFMKDFVPGGLMLDPQEESDQNGNYLPRIRIRLLKSEPGLVNAARFYTPIIGMWIGLVLSSHYFVEKDNFYNAVLSIVMTLTIAYPQLVREKDVGELILFNFTLVMFLLSLIGGFQNDKEDPPYGYRAYLIYCPLLSLLSIIFSYFIKVRWLREMKTYHDTIIKQTRLPKKDRKYMSATATTDGLIDIREEMQMRNMTVTKPHVLNLPSNELSDIFPTYTDD